MTQTIEPRNQTIQVRVTKSEKEKLEKYAVKKEKTVSSLLYQMIKQSIIPEKPVDDFLD